MKYFFAGLAAISLAVPAAAQSATNDEPLLVAPLQAPPSDVQYLPANTEVVVAMNDTITTNGKAFHEGDTFSLTVQDPVFLNDLVVIPKGARAVGRITWLTSKGAFGKSGKMDIDIEYAEVNGRRVPLEGHFRQEGEGNTVATVGGVVAVGVLAGFITGKSAVIPRGRELTVRTREEVPVRVARSAPVPFASQPRQELAISARGASAAQAVSAAPRARQVSQTNPWGLEPVGSN
jgi:hypothetical protein